MIWTSLSIVEILKRTNWGYRLKSKIIYEILLDGLRKYILLESADIISITESTLGLDNELVRVISINETSECELELEVEEMQLGSASSVLYSNQITNRTQIDYNIEPGDTNEIIIFEAPLDGLRKYILLESR